MAAGVEEPGIIDLVTHDPSTGEVVLIMIQTRSWDAGPRQADQLLAKINTYLHFVESGELVRRFPRAAGKPLRFQIDCNTPPIGAARQLIEEAQRLLLERGIAFAQNVIVSAAGA